MIKSWSEMPIRVLMEIDEIGQLHCSDDEKTFKTTALLAGMPYEEFIELPLDKARELVAETYFFDQEPEKVKVKKFYHLGTRDYKMMKNVDDMTTSQYINFQAIVGSERQMLPELMAIILVPKGFKYGDGYDMDEITEEIANNLSVEEGLAIADFFIASSERRTEALLRRSSALATAARIMAPKKDKEKMKVLEMQIHLLNDALRSESGYNWRKQWQS